MAGLTSVAAGCRDSGAELARDADDRGGTALDIGSTPTYFINGEKYEGALPIDYIFGQIDNALRAEGVTPPPPYVAPGRHAT